MSGLFSKPKRPEVNIPELLFRSIAAQEVPKVISPISEAIKPTETENKEAADVQKASADLLEQEKEKLQPKKKRKTILTSPQGLLDEAPVTKKTLLGD